MLALYWNGNVVFDKITVLKTYAGSWIELKQSMNEYTIFVVYLK